MSQVILVSSISPSTRPARIARDPARAVQPPPEQVGVRDPQRGRTGVRGDQRSVCQDSGEKHQSTRARRPEADP